MKGSKISINKKDVVIKASMKGKNEKMDEY